jgi:peptide/nickel transport system substrate-binding protein
MMRRFLTILLLSCFTGILLLPTVDATVPITYKKSDLKAGRYGGTIISAIVGEPSSFNPLAANNAQTQELLRVVFDSLAEINPDSLALEPALAEKWTVSKDALLWQFVLRQGLNWSDGAPLTSKDVLFSLDLFMNNVNSGIWRNYWTAVDLNVSYRAMDDRTVEFRLAHPCPYLPIILPPILPQHAFVNTANNQSLSQIWPAQFDLSMIVGTGPFIPQEYVPGVGVTYTRNPFYWRADRSQNVLPYGDRWTVRIFSSESKLLESFQRNELDWAAISTAQRDSFMRNRRAGRYECIDSKDSLQNTFFVFNQNPGAPPYKANEAPLTWFRNPAFRKAIAYVIDHSAIIRDIYSGYAAERQTIIPPVLKDYYYARVSKYSSILRKEEDLLEEAGFMPGRDKVLYDNKGNRVEFPIMVTIERPDLVEMAGLIARQLQRVGITAFVKPVSAAAMSAALQENYQWQTAIIPVTSHPEPGLQLDLWHSSGSLHYWNPRQTTPLTSWESSIDQILAELSTTSDHRKRADLYETLQVIIAEELPLIPLPVQNEVYAVRSRIKNADEIPLYGGLANRLPNFWIGFSP